MEEIQLPTDSEKNESELLSEFQDLCREACELVIERRPDLEPNMPGEDMQEEARFAYRQLASDTEAETYEQEAVVKAKMEKIKEAVPELPLQ